VLAGLPPLRPCQPSFWANCPRPFLQDSGKRATAIWLASLWQAWPSSPGSQLSHPLIQASPSRRAGAVLSPVRRPAILQTVYNALRPTSRHPKPAWQAPVRLTAPGAGFLECAILARTVSARNFPALACPLLGRSGGAGLGSTSPQPGSTFHWWFPLVRAAAARRQQENWAAGGPNALLSSPGRRPQ